MGIFEHPQGVDISFINTQTRNVTTLGVGDRLAGGTIVMADFRWMTSVNDEDRQTPSRVIILIGDSYWAVDLNMNIRDRYRLGPDRLPPELLQEQASVTGSDAES